MKVNRDIDRYFLFVPLFVCSLTHQISQWLLCGWFKGLRDIPHKGVFIPAREHTVTIITEYIVE